MVDVRRILIIFVIAVLFSVLVFSTISAFYPSPEYDDYCGKEFRFDQPKPVKQRPDNYKCPDTDFNETAMNECRAEGGDVRYTDNEYSCPVDWGCSYCQKNYEDAREEYNFWKFLISGILGILAIIVAIVLPMRKDSVHEWVGSGLMLGGLISIFIGTAITWSDLFRWLRPIIILLELVLVIYLAYKKLKPDE